MSAYPKVQFLTSANAVAQLPLDTGVEEDEEVDPAHRNDPEEEETESAELGQGIELRREQALPVAVVDADNCNGCRRCVADCPYAAITLEAHPNGKPGRQIAVVAAEDSLKAGARIE